MLPFVEHRGIVPNPQTSIPELHGRQMDAPSLSENVPVGHDKHVSAAVDPFPVEYVPLAQFRQVSAETAAADPEYFPG